MSKNKYLKVVAVLVSGMEACGDQKQALNSSLSGPGNNENLRFSVFVMSFF